MPFYLIDPEVPGGLGDRTELTPRPDAYPIVNHVHFEFEYGAQGNDLITSHPVYLVTPPLADALGRSRLSGFVISADVDVTVDENVAELDPEWQPPDLRWLQVTGDPGRDDFGLTTDARLVASSDALEVLRQFNIDDCDVSAIELP